MTRRRATPKLPPAPRPWPVVVLAIDPGETSGWAIWAQGRYVDSGEVDVFDHDAVRKVIRAALQLAELAFLPCVLVLERPWSASRLGASRRLWSKAWEHAGASARRIVRPWVSSWRAAVLGRGMGAATKEVARRAEQATARRFSGKAELGGDEAAAVCIGRWAANAGEVGKALGKRACRQAGMGVLCGG